MNQASRVVVVEPNGQAQLELAPAAEQTAAAAAQAFGGQQGIQVNGSGNVTINGLRATAVEFSATTSQGQALVGEAMFVEYNGSVYRLLGLSLASAASTMMAPLQAAIRSFAPTAASQQFQRVRELHVVRLTSPTTPTRLASQSGGAVTADELALINSVQPGEMMPTGREVKTVRWR